MLRAIKEFFKPKLKCKRLGHQMEAVKHRLYVKPWKMPHGYGVIHDAIGTREECARCGYVQDENHWDDLENITAISSFTCPSYMDRVQSKLGWSFHSPEKTKIQARKLGLLFID